MGSIRELTITDLNRIFKKFPLYSQEDKKDHRVILEFYIPNQNIYWLITEGSIEYGDFIMFGYCKITDGELGYVSFKELVSTNFDIRYKIHKRLIKLSKLKQKYTLF